MAALGRTASIAQESAVDGLIDMLEDLKKKGVEHKPWFQMTISRDLKNLTSDPAIKLIHDEAAANKTIQGIGGETVEMRVDMFLRALRAVENNEGVEKVKTILSGREGGRKKGRKSRRASFRRMFRLYGGASIAVQTLLTKLGDVAGSSVDDDAEASITMDAELARQAKNEIVRKLDAMKAAKDSTTSSLFGKLKQGVAKLTGPAEDTASTEEVKQMLEELARDGNTTASPNDFQGYLNKINRAMAFVPAGGKPKKTRRHHRRR